MQGHNAALNAILLLLAWASFWRTISWTRPGDPCWGLTVAKSMAEAAALLLLFRPGLPSIAIALGLVGLNIGVQFAARKRWALGAMLGAAVLGSILVLALHWSGAQPFEWSGDWLGGERVRPTLLTLIGLGLMMQDGNLLIAGLFWAIRLKAPSIPATSGQLPQRDVFEEAQAARADATASAPPGSQILANAGPLPADSPAAAPPSGNVAPAGRFIGILERSLIYFFALSGSLQAVGFVLAAKAFARFKEMDHRPFAEYVLIGTLLSTTIALGVAEIVLRLR
jgi:hypothetical protein